MATKKEKRQRGLERHQERMEAYRQEGLKALKLDRARRFKEKLKEWEKIHNEKHFKFVDECPHCQVVRAASNTKVEADVKS